MRNHTLFTGTLFISVGGLFLLHTFEHPLRATLHDWPITLLILGLAFLIQGTVGRETYALFPGVLLVGLSLHFFSLSTFSLWPESWAIYTLIIGIAFLTQKKAGLKTAFLFISISLLALFYPDFQRWQHHLLSFLGGFWPLILIGLGAYFIFKKNN